jgi:hypothetical protein
MSLEAKRLPVSRRDDSEAEAHARAEAILAALGVPDCEFPRGPPPRADPPRHDRPALAVRLLLTWRDSMEIGSHDRAMRALERLRNLAARPQPGHCWEWKERIRQ